MRIPTRVLPVLAVLVLVGMATAGTVFAGSGGGGDGIRYQELKAGGAIPPPVQSPSLPYFSRGGDNLTTAVVHTQGLLIPRDTTFSVAPFTSGTPPDYRNDDGSTDSIPLGFTFRFFGTPYTHVYINNNGNISFGESYSSYTSTGFPSNLFAMIAPFWADVDTRNPASGLVYFKSEAHRFIVIWESVGYYGNMADLVNTFELIITDGTDPLVGVGRNVCLSYADMQWTTGSASGGSGGFGGTPATVGANRGDSLNFAQIGRFDHPGTDYDGPGGNPDGVSYLDDRVFYFNIAQGLGTVTGTVFLDANANCAQDTGEPGLQGWVVRLEPGGVFSSTDADGRFFFSFLPPGTYTLSEVLRPNWQQTCPTPVPTYTINLDSGQTVTNRLFGNRPVGSAQDLAVSVAGGTARPGFQKSYGIRYDNLGAVAVIATVRLTLPAQVTHLQASPGGTFNSGGWVDWALGTVQPGATGWLWERVQIPASVPLNTVLTSTVQITPVTGDARPWDNTDSESQVVRGSFDPNDILVSPEGTITPADTLEYTIRFQNTGTDTAFNVRVSDVLESDLDPATVVPGASSHAYTFQVVAPSELVFRFDSINLLDSNASEPASHGFVKFRVQPRSTVTPGAVIENGATIFFDFNPGVATNVVTNTIGGGLTVYPGDADNDALVDVRDILPLGRHFGLTGPARPNASLNWVPQGIFLPWTPAEAAYADCDGNGTVDGNDVQAIVTNWFRTHANPDAAPVDPLHVCEQLLAEIDAQGTLSPGMKDIRRAVVDLLQRFGVVFTYALEQNWPNPFNPATTIRFSVPEETREVRLTIYSILGQPVWETVMNDVQPGGHAVRWEGLTASGTKAPSGVYFYRLDAGPYSAVKRMLLVK